MNNFEFDIEKLHKTQLDILREFDRVCRKYDLKYFLAYGTLIGAVRHNGFIPWDDDIDLVMLYDDYTKLQTVPQNEWNKPYFLQNPDTDKYYNKCYMKLRNSQTTLVVDEVSDLDINHGVAIDIYPIIHLTDDLKKRKRQYMQTKLYMLLRYDRPPYNNGKIMYWGSKTLLTLIPNFLKKSLRNKMLNNITSYQNVRTEFCYAVIGSVKTMMRKIPTSVFDRAVLHEFEGETLPIPIGYDTWLKKGYGDYMKLPPIEEQGIKLEHFIKIDLDNPYTVYKGKYYCI